MSCSRKKVAVITGATGGIGQAVAYELAARGFRVVVTGRNRKAGQETVSNIENLGGEAIFVPADLEYLSEAETVAAKVIDAYGRLDAVISSAGLPPAAQGYFGDLDIAAAGTQASRTLQVKLYPIQACLPYMIEQEQGAILLVTSEGGRFPTPGQTTVAFHSGGLLQTSRVLAKEVSRYKIRVNSLCVTIVEDTPTWERHSGGTMTPQRQRMFDKIIEKAPLGIASAGSIAKTAAFLVSEDAAYITGSTFSATGGLT